MHLPIGLLTLAVVACLAYVYQAGARINALHTPMMDAAHHVEKDITLFHLWVEELIGGNPSNSEDEIFRYVDDAILSTEFIIEGSYRNTDLNLSFDNPELRQVANSVLFDLKDFREIGEKRLATIEQDGTSPYDDVFDGTFDVIMTQADDMEGLLEEIIEKQFSSFGRMQIGLIAACLIFGVFVMTRTRQYEQQKYKHIVEKFQAQGVLRENRDRLALALRASGAGVFDQVLHPQVGGKVDEQWARMLGYSLDEIPPVDNNFFSWWESLVHPDDVQKFRRAREQIIKGNKTNCEIEVRHLHKKGHWVYLHIFCSIGDRDQDGRVNRVVGMIIDDTKNIMSELENARLATVVKQAGEAVCILDTDGLIQYVNPAFERSSGYTESELIGNSLTVVEDKSRSSQSREQMWHDLRNGEVWSGTLFNLRKNGERYEVAQSISPIMSVDNSTSGYAVIQRDITFERRLQAKMEHSDRLESLGVLAGGIAHDFNNLLTAIMGNASIATMKLQQPSATKAEGRTTITEHLQRIENSCKSAADLCKQMLAYSGRGKFEVKSTNLSVVVEEMSKLMAVSLSKNTELKFNLADNLPEIEADTAQLQQVIMNLLTNASEAISSGGTKGRITVSTGVAQANKLMLERSMTGEELTPGQYVYLRVSDNGCGMDEATKKKIFDPFFTTKFTGRGLGMSAMLGIVRGHKGALTLETQKGKGSCFTVMFPHAGLERQIEDQATINASGTLSGIRPGKILVIDDDESIRETASMMLATLGFSVLTAQDGLQGLEVFRDHEDEIAAVLLDMTMPNMNGEECFHELKRISPDVKVILSSGYAEDEATKRFSGLGLAGFVQKPYGTQHLRHGLRRALT